MPDTRSKGVESRPCGARASKEVAMASTLLSQLMPAFSLREADHVSVAADPERAWPLARGLDVARIPFVRALFELRIVPERIAAFARGKRQPGVASVGIEAI